MKLYRICWRPLTIRQASLLAVYAFPGIATSHPAGACPKFKLLYGRTQWHRGAAVVLFLGLV